jgi:penicillin-binding protein 1A
LVFEADPNAPRERLLSETTVAGMNSMLRGVVTGGTGRRADVPGVPVVGNSGTTSSYRDAWFCGFTGNYVAAVWFGNDDYHPTKTLTGGTLPAIAWQKFMAYAHTNIDIKPVFGVDFVPTQTVVAAADPAEEQVEVAQRPPTLTPAAARKLLDLAGLFRGELRAATPINNQAAVRGSSAGL